MGISEDTIQNTVLLLKHQSINTQEILKNQSQILENQAEMLAALQGQRPPAPDPSPPASKFVWSDSLTSDVAMPLVIGPEGQGYMSQGLGDRLRGPEGLSLDYKARPWRSQDGPRNEIGRWKSGATSQSYQRDDYNTTHWYDFKIRLAEEDQYPPNDHNRAIHFQIHGPSGLNPILSLDCYVAQRRWVWLARSETKPHRVVWPAEGLPIGDFTGNIEYERWVQWTIEACWALGDLGFIRLWKDGALVYETRGETCFDDEKPPYQCMGIYYPDGRKNDPDIDFPEMRRKVWLKDFRVGDISNEASDFF